MKLRFLFLLFIFQNYGCSSKTDPINNEVDTTSYVIMVSIDGFRHDYAEKFNATNLLEMKKNGAWTQAMTPSFPSKTFPNHYTLVTGMYPGTHGIVSNKFYSKSRDEYYAIGKPSVGDGSWYGGTPLWVLAEQNNMKSASFFWVGSEAEIQGVRPTYYEKYDGSIPNEDRVEQVLKWLDLPVEQRPQFITLYFSEVDDKGHGFGPDARQTKKAVLSIDENIGALRKGIAESGLDITLIVTSDHGMVTINEGLYLDVDWRGAKTAFSSTNVSIYHDDPSVVGLIKSDLEEIANIQVHEAGNFPEEYHFENPDRSGDLLVTIDPPRVFSSSNTISGGTHGFDPYRIEEMHTIFHIEGAGIKSNYEIPSFENVHVYPLVANLLGLPIPNDIDGDEKVLLQVIKE